MKRALHFVLSTLVLLSTVEASAAAKKQSKNPKPRVYKAQPGPAIAVSPRPKPQRNRMGIKAQSDSELVAAPGPVSAGPPKEGSMRRAGSTQLDLRFLPQTLPIRQERPEREPPIVKPVTIQGNVVPPKRNIAAPAPLNAPAPSPSTSFPGLDFATWGAGHPPDTVGDVGPNHYIQAVNTSIGIYGKSGGAPLAALNFNVLMSQGHFGNLCDTDNFGDPVVLYDTFEDRWVISDFAFKLSGSDILNPPGAFQCFAVSKTGDPISGGWNFYSLHLTDAAHDYPKLGIWPDGIYMSANMFGFPATGSFEGTRVWALNKAQMYAGAPAIQVVQFNPPAAEFTLLPSNARLQAGTPPAGSPNYFSTVWNFTNAVSTYKFHVDWNRISLSTFDGPFVTIAPASWLGAPDFAAAKNGNANDTLATRLMMQNQYTNLGGVESLWQTHTVQNPSTPSAASVRYYQTNVTGGSIAANTTQAATHAPDAISRYMPSLAVDRAGNMAVGYTASSSTLYPAIRYAGRLAGDAVNTLPQTETSLIEGTGSQSVTNRWGDYSAMSLDPDGCTFWYTNEYYADIGGNWQTRIGSFNYGPSACMPVATGTVSGTVTAAAGGAAIAGATVSFGSRTTTTGGGGVYSFASIPSGSYPGITVTAPGFNAGSATNIVVTDATITTQNFSLSAAPASGCVVETTQADFQTGIPTNTDLASTPGAVILLNAPVLDQQNTSLSGSGVGIDTANWGGEMFTSGLTGPLTSADVSVFCFGCTGTSPNLTLSLRATSGGLPTGPDLATTTLAGNSSGAASYLTGTFANPAIVTAGTAYALIVRPVANPSAGTYALTLSNFTSSFGNSQRVASTDNGATWSGTSNDLCFRTYVKTAFANSGDFVSALKDANPPVGSTPIWSTLSWNATVPANTSLTLQVAASNSATGPFAFVGPDGTAATFFTTSGASLSQFYGFRYLKYKAFLATTDTTQTPALNDVTICYSVADCSTPIAITASSQVCAASTGNTASGPAGAASYAWFITNGTIAGSTTSQSVTYTAGGSGSAGLTLNIVDAAGCKKSASANVPIVATPTPTVTPGGPTTFCTGGSVTLTSSSAAGNQWYNGAAPLAGQTNQTYVATTAGNYNVIVTASGCSSAASASTAVTVNAIPATPTITPGGPTTFCAGSSVTLTSSSATGNQWYNGEALLAGQTSQTYVAAATGNYNVVVTASGCSSAPSSSAAVTVTPLPPTPTVTPSGPATFCTGGSVTLTSSSATGNQWFNGTTLLAGQTSQTYVATTTGNYNVVVTASGCSSAPSASTAVTVNSIPATPTITPGGPTTFCAGNSVTLTSSSATGNQWYNGATLLAGQTNQTYAASATGNYNVVVTATGCPSATSSSIAVTVNPLPPAPSITPGGPTTFCIGGSVTLTSSSASGNQWYLNGSAIGGASSQTYAATASGNYTVKVTDGNSCTSALSAITTVTVNPIPATPAISPSGSVQFCSGGSKTLTSSSATGNQWYLEGVAINGATNQTVSAGSAGHYTVVVTTNGCVSAPSAATNVIINPTPATPVITPGGPTTFCAGGSVTLTSSSATGNQWYNGATLLAGQTSQTYVATATGNYNVVVTANGCSSAPSSSAAVTVTPLPPTPTVTPSGPATFCTGGSVTLTSSSATGNQWYNGTTLLAGQTSQTFVATSTGNYNVVVTATGCASAPSASTAVTVNSIPATPAITAGATTFCAGGSVNLTSSSASGNQWFLNGNAIVGATNQLYNAAASGNYTVTVTTSGCTSAASAATIVTVNPKPNATITAPASVITNSTGNVASVANAGAGATYSWTIAGGAITAGAGTNRVTFTAGGAGTITVNVTVTTSAGCSDTKFANVTAALPPVTVTAVAPALGATAGGSPITINGSGFVSGAGVSVGGTAATNVVVVSATKITAKTPAHASGLVNVAVTNADTSTATLTSAFRYQAFVFDPNADTVVDPADIFFLINYLFTGGQAPHGEAGLLSGDANNDLLVDPADIFFIINYLFLGGQKPSTAPGTVSAASVRSATPQIAGSVTLGKAVRRAGHYIVPVTLTSRGEATPQAMSLRVRLESDFAIGDVAIRHAGVATDVIFETSRRSANDLSYVVAYDPRGLVLGVSRSAVVAEIDIVSVQGHIEITVDSQLTMLSNQAGTMKATVGNQTLQVTGTTIGELPRSRVPGHDVN